MLRAIFGLWSTLAVLHYKAKENVVAKIQIDSYGSSGKTCHLPCMCVAVWKSLLEEVGKIVLQDEVQSSRAIFPAIFLPKIPQKLVANFNTLAWYVISDIRTWFFMWFNCQIQCLPSTNAYHGKSLWLPDHTFNFFFDQLLFTKIFI